MSDKIVRLQNRLKVNNSWLNNKQAERYLELIGKYRSDEEEEEKNQLLKIAANTEPPEEEGED